MAGRPLRRQRLADQKKQARGSKKLTPELREQICAYVRRGSFRETACAAVGITSRTLRYWLAEAAKAREEGRSNRFTKLADAMSEAEAQAEVRDVGSIAVSGRKDWKALAWILERRASKRWGYKQSLEVTGKDGEPLLAGVVVLPVEEALPEAPAPDESDGGTDGDG